MAALPECLAWLTFMHACRPPWMSTLSPDRAPLRYSEDVRVATNSAVSLIGRLADLKPPTGLWQGVTLSKQRFSHYTIIIFNFLQSIKIGERCGNTAATLPIVGNRCHTPMEIKNKKKPDRKIGVYSTVSSYSAKSTLTNLQWAG